MKYTPLLIVGALVAFSASASASMEDKIKNTREKTDAALKPEEIALIERQQKDLEEFHKAVEELFLSQSDKKKK